jgi:hypothetical protein
MGAPLPYDQPDEPGSGPSFHEIRHAQDAVIARRGADVQFSKAAEADKSVNTSSLRQSLAGCALTCLAVLTPGLVQAQATEAPQGALLPPGLLANKSYTTPAPSAAVAPIESLTQIRASSDVERLRADSIKQIWPDGFPTGTPDGTPRKHLQINYTLTDVVLPAIGVPTG